jgi:tryptophanyl-tRNA synthetase
MEKQKIDPWGSQTFDTYDEIYHVFGIEPVSDEVREHFPDNYFFERNIIIGYRDFDKIIEQMENKKDFILVSGFASSGEFHFGHKAVIDVYNYFRKFTRRGYFVVCDLDAYVSRPDSKIPSLEKAREYAVDNIANALALGVPKEDIRIQSKQTPEYFSFSHMVAKKVTANTLQAALGHIDLGKFAATYLQISDILYPQLQDGVAPTLIPVGIDQEPIIRLTRDVARKFSTQLGFEIPSSIYLSHVPGLTGAKHKMSKSEEGSAILLTEDEINLKRLIGNAFTGGRDTKEEQRKLGGRPGICPVCTMYKFNHPDSAFVQDIFGRELAGKLLCGENKKILYEFLAEFLKEHKEKYNKYVDVARQMLE